MSHKTIMVVMALFALLLLGAGALALTGGGGSTRTPAVYDSSPTEFWTRHYATSLPPTTVPTTTLPASTTVVAAGKVLERQIEPAPEPLAELEQQPEPEPEFESDTRALGYELMISFGGFGHDQWECLDKLWTAESGWRVNADNPNSSAYGIPQALPGSKMGPGWQDDAGVQIRWGLEYVHGRYGTPCGAWAAFRAKGWY